MIKQTDRVLAEELVKRGALTQQAVEQHLQKIKDGTASLKDYLVKNQFISEHEILECLAAGLRLSTFNLKSAQIDPEVIEKVPVRIAWYYRVMPIRIESGKLTLASTSPLDVKIQDEIRLHLRLEPQVVLARETDIMEAINKYYGLAADTIDKLTKEAKKGPPTEDETLWVEDLEKDADEASVANLVNQILLEAHKKRATDIHIEPYRNMVRVRYRVDGVLVDANIPPAVRPFMASIISRIKIMANLSIVEKRMPQDGSTVVKTKEQDLDLRISTIPTQRGESMVIRILPTQVMLLSLEKLGFDEGNLVRFRELIKKPHGIILVTGPTGSGKSTTLYASLNEINSLDRKIITIEDPIEYEMEGVTQIQVNNKVDLTFAAGLRSVLRHDPDIIMVGEIRDLETVEIAIRTALTGHLVFSTLHTNDAASAVTRLVEMGLEPFLVASSIEAFVAQRLVRIICQKCKAEVPDPLPEIRAEISKSLNIPIKDVRIYAGKGCDHCNRTGYYGRTAIYEILTVNDEIRAAILDKARADQIKQLAMANGMKTMRQDGWRRIVAGITTPAEVMNITAPDEDPLILKQAQKVDELVERTIDPEILKSKNEYDTRIYSRLDDRIAIRYVVVKQDDGKPDRIRLDRVEHSSMTKDISAGGLRFVSGYTLPVGTILELKIQLEPQQRSIDCLAKICRVEDDSMSAMFSLVAYYLDISSADRARIDRYVRDKEKKEAKDNPSGKKTKGGS